MKKGKMLTAQLVGEKLVKMHKNKIIAIGVFGSMARNGHNQYSDIDLIIITKKKVKDKFFILLNSNNDSREKLILGRDVKVSLFFKTKKDAFSQLTSIDEFPWVIEVAMLLNILPLYDPKGVFLNLQNEFINLKKDLSNNKKFKCLAGKWLSFAYEFLGKINNPDSSRQEVFVYAERFSFAIVGAYKALHQDYFKNIYKITQEAETLLPDHRRAVFIIESLLTSRDTKTINQLSMELWLITKQLAEFHKIKIEFCTKGQLNILLKTL